MLYQEAHVDRAIEGIQKKILIDILAQLAATNAPFERGIGFPPAGPKEAVAKGGDEVFIALAGGQDGGNDAAPAAAKDLR